jgi:uncharacterized delta-60 repeat protein
MNPTEDRSRASKVRLGTAVGSFGRARRVAGLALVFVALSSPLSQRSRADAGDLDATFGTDGKVRVDFSGSHDSLMDVALMSDGRIVAVGSAASAGVTFAALARFEADGSLDTSFGIGGKVTTTFLGVFDRANAVAIQPDGRIVVAGVTFRTSSRSDILLARYDANGSLDQTFGSGGWVTTSVVNDFNGADAVLLQPDGRIAVAGYGHDRFSNGLFVLARYEADGSPDPSFGSGGSVTTDFPGSQEQAYALAMQPDGRLVAGGVASDDFALARYHPDGSLDTTFDGDGRVTTDFFGDEDVVYEVRIQPDGKIVAAGTGSMVIPFQDIGDHEFALARYNADGTLDTDADADPAVHFDFDGWTRTDFSDPPGGPFQEDRAFAMVLQPDGKIVAAGVGGTNMFGPGVFLALARYHPDGSLDASFGSDGRVLTDLHGGRSGARGLALQPDGKIVAAGFSNTGNLDFALARYDEGAPVVSLVVGVRVIPSTFNPCTNRRLHQAAVLSEPGFDALTVEVTTVRLGEAPATFGRVDDVDDDGDDDVVFVFPFQSIGVDCGDTSLSLTGETTDGQSIRGGGPIHTVGCNPGQGCP